MTTETVLVWGANGGIGRAILEQQRELGKTVIGIVRDASELDDIDGVIEADVNDWHAVQTAVQEIAVEYPAIDLFIYAIGDVALEKLDSISDADWQRIIDANLTGAFRATQASLPLMNESSHMVFVGAMVDKLILPKFAAYAASKAGLEAFAKTLAREEKRKLRVTVVRPGAVNTPFWEKIPLNLPKRHITSDAVAHAIEAAHSSGYSGILDV